MNRAVLIYPHQLYKNHPALNSARKTKDTVYVVEDTLFFGDRTYTYSFHKLKLVLHRATMKRYVDEVLEQDGWNVKYIAYADLPKVSSLFEILQSDGIDTVSVADPTDFMLGKRIRRYCGKYKIDLEWHESPNFVTSRDQLDEFYEKHQKGKKKFFHARFYKWQRKRMDILIDASGEPVGGKWSYDQENRKKLPKNHTPPSPKVYGDNQYVADAIAYVQEHWPDNPGGSTILAQQLDNSDSGLGHSSDISDTNNTFSYFIYPTNHAEAEEWLAAFLEQRFDLFGPYEDAISHDSDFVYHSLLSPLINIGLLNPKQVIDAVLAYSADDASEARLASVEGFVRQVIGWREFMRALYIWDGVRMRSSNFFKHTRDVSEHWYEGTTGYVPIDTVIKKIQKYAYAHHIERLMLLGNSMLLHELHPDQVYQWFMEMFIDAYDWVMVPNVYGMSQFADGGSMVTKPYVSGSNYVRKMSSYGKAKKAMSDNSLVSVVREIVKGTKTERAKLDSVNPKWDDAWDVLFWRFIEKHQDFLTNNARMGMLVRRL